MFAGQKVKFKNSFTCGLKGTDSTLHVLKGEVGTVSKALKAPNVMVEVRGVQKQKPNDAGFRSTFIIKVDREILECLTQYRTVPRADATSSCDGEAPSGPAAGGAGG